MQACVWMGKRSFPTGKDGARVVYDIFLNYEQHKHQHIVVYKYIIGILTKEINNKNMSLLIHLNK